MATASKRSDDRCEPIRQNILLLEGEISSIEADLAPPLELPPDIIKELRKILKKDLALLARLQQTLVSCEAIPEMPTRK
jgi:hypothetical protein